MLRLVVTSVGAVALRVVLSKLTLGLLALDLKRSCVNLDQNIPLVNVLTFLEGHVDNLTVHAAAHGDGVKCRYGSQSVEVDRKIATLRGGNHDGHDKIAHSAGATAASA